MEELNKYSHLLVGRKIKSVSVVSGEIIVTMNKGYVLIVGSDSYGETYSLLKKNDKVICSHNYY